MPGKLKLVTFPIPVKPKTYHSPNSRHSRISRIYLPMICSRRESDSFHSFRDDAFDADGCIFLIPVISMIKCPFCGSRPCSPICQSAENRGCLPCSVGYWGIWGGVVPPHSCHDNPLPSLNPHSKYM